MKNVRLLLLVLFAATILSTADAVAQGKSKKKQKNEKKGGGPPPWAPAHGYRAKTRYVYFQDYPVYYDNDRGVYIDVWKELVYISQITRYTKGRGFTGHSEN